MSKKSREKEFHFNLFVLIRWLIFAALIYLAISSLSQKKSTLDQNSVFSDAPTSSLNLGFISSQPVIIDATGRFNFYKESALNYINQQIVDIKKQIITQIYQDIIKSIENPQK